MGSLYVLIKGHSSGTRPGSKSGRTVGTSRSPWAYAPRAQGSNKASNGRYGVESEYRGKEPCKARALHYHI